MTEAERIEDLMGDIDRRGWLAMATEAIYLPEPLAFVAVGPDGEQRCYEATGATVADALAAALALAIDAEGG